MGSFSARTRQLGEQVGEGDLTGSVTVDQPYAVNQHEMGWLNFMGRYGPKPIRRYHRGGGAKFLEAPLMEKGPTEYMQRLANRALDPGGLVEAMVENMEDLCDEVHERAPRDRDVLRDSASPKVTDGGTVAYERPPRAARER